MSESKALSPIAQVCSAITSPEFRAKIQQALPPGVDIDRFVRVTLTAIQQNPSVVEADRQSLYNACIRAAQDGLLPDGRQGAIVVFNKKNGDQWVKSAQFMPMRQGLIDKAAKYGISIEAQTVHENDTFEYELGDNPTIHHKAPKLGQDRGKIIGAYAIATLKDGTKKREIMPLQEIEQIRQASRSKDSGPWKDWFGEMAKKSAIRRLYKNLPMSEVDERDRKVMLEDDDVQFIDVNPPAAAEPVEQQRSAPAKPSKLKETMRHKAAPDTVVEQEGVPSNDAGDII